MPYLLNDALVTGAFVVDEVQYPPNVLDLWSRADLEAIGLVWVDPPAPQPLTLAEVKAARLEAIAARRRVATSVVSVGPMTIPWNDTTENRVANAIAALTLKPEGATVSWEVTRGVFATLDLVTLQAIGLAAFDRQQAAFDTVRALSAQVMTANDAEAVAAVDIEVGWP